MEILEQEQETNMIGKAEPCLDTLQYLLPSQCVGGTTNVCAVCLTKRELLPGCQGTTGAPKSLVTAAATLIPQ